MKRIAAAAVLFYVFLLVAKLVAAARLSLFGDEAFYFECARRLALAYSDHPFMTALFVRGGIEIFGPTTFATRFLFIVVGAAMPFLVYALGRPHVSTRDAFLGACLSLLVPATAWFGVLAIPDAPLMLFVGLSLLAFDRAVRSGSPGWFALAGIATALGLATHLRFVFVPFAFFVFLLATPLGRAQWKRLGLYLYTLVALPGFLPVLLLNIAEDFRPLKFQGEERHEGGAQLDGILKHVPAQMAACTPLLYVALIATLIVVTRRAFASRPQKESTPALFALVSLVHLGVFFATSPIADTSHASIHWPAPGYLPLLPFVPGVLREFCSRGAVVVRRALTRFALAFAGIVLMLAFLELMAHPFEIEALKKPFTGYEVAAASVEKELLANPSHYGAPPLVVADHYILGGNLEQQLLEKGIAIDLFVLDHAKNREHGRALQYELWRMDEPSLARLRAGRTALVIAEKNQSSGGKTRPQSWGRWEPHIAGLFETLTPLDRVVKESGGKEPRDFRLYRGDSVKGR